MRFGITLESFTPPGKVPSSESLLKMATLAESLGFDSLWVWDHVLLGSRKVFPVLDSLTTLASVGARTRRIKLGTSVLLLALRNPILVSKIISTIQLLTGDRLIIGTASGWYEKEFRAIGTDFDRRGKILEEEFKLVRRLLSEPDVSTKSQYFDFDRVSIEPRPMVPVPMLIGGYSDFVLKRAGRLADGWVTYYYTPEGFADAWTKVLSSADNARRDSKALHSVDIVPLAIAESLEEGDRIAREFTAKYMDLPKNTNCTVESSIKGNIADCIDQIKRYEKAGVQELVFVPCNYDIEQVELAGRKILPNFK